MLRAPRLPLIVRFSKVRAMKTSSLLLLSVLAASFAACGGTTQEPATAPNTVEEPAPSSAEPAEQPAAEASASGEAAPELPPAPETWSDDLSHEQKAAFMVERVMPAMQPVFAQAPEFNCATCHGKAQVESKHFEHPNEALPRLTFEKGAITSFKTNPEVSKFMAEKVLPAMAQVMGKPMMSKDEPNGMGCNGCHAVDMK